MASSIAIRLAAPEEGPLVGSLVKAFGGPQWEWLDWSSVYPYWLIGEVNGHPEGTIMASPGRPFGRVECLCVNPALPKRVRAALSRDLGYAGVACCRAQGAQAVWSNFDQTDIHWAHIAARRGWAPVGQGIFAMKRCL